ncbi:arabinogalactan protein 13-like [Raphanus sativus]|uniref:Arabinogalactan protein 13-like n=1 Tax=Raphanus sativus TaxID=3726 RepID=A0A6J0MBR4_RAPSA|nr:arabinogalactan protein 13-like [Raphanus sativus]XP_056854403.1 arabinogalactan protein 13-like [Raphanus sativus]
MEATKMKLVEAVLVVMMAFSALQQAAAVEAPAPSPTSDASLSIPAFVATVATLAFGFLF